MRLSRPRSLAELAELAGREIRARLAELGSPDLAFEVSLVGDPETMIEAVCPVEALEPGCLTFATNRSYLDRVEDSPAAAVVLTPALSSARKPYLQAPAPRLVFSVILELEMGERTLVPAAEGGVRFKDRSRVEIGEDVVFGDWCYVGAEVKIGRGCRIYPGVFLDDEVTLGEECVLYPQVTLFRRTTLGRKVVIHAGAVLGDDGFGYNQIPDPRRGRLHHLKNEHLGGVLIEDFVELGSLVCVDRGLAGLTVVGAGTKVDNQVQIGHNVQVGRECIIVSHAAIGGHARLGDRVFVLGQVGIKDGAHVGDDAILLGKTAVFGDLPAGRTHWAGIPAQEAERQWKQVALARRELPRLRRFLRAFAKADSFAQLKAEFLKSEEREPPEER